MSMLRRTSMVEVMVRSSGAIIYCALDGLDAVVWVEKSSQPRSRRAALKSIRLAPDHFAPSRRAAAGTRYRSQSPCKVKQSRSLQVYSGPAL